MSSKLSKLLRSPVVLAYAGLTDEELMAKIQQGSLSAYEALYNRYEVSVWNFMRVKISDEQARLDLAQDVFLKLFNSASLFKTDQAFRPWFWAMIRNVIIDHFKRKDALSSSMIKEEIQDDQINENQLFNDPTFDLMVQKNHSEAVENCFNHLTDSQKEVLSLQLFSGLSLQQIADQVKIKPGAVKSLLFRGKDSLMKCLERYT